VKAKHFFKIAPQGIH